MSHCFDVVEVRSGEAVSSRKVLGQRAVNASISRSDRVIPGYVVLPSRVVGDHRTIDDVDDVALLNASGAAAVLGSFMSTFIAAISRW
jgi:hypothetical protein